MAQSDDDLIREVREFCYTVTNAIAHNMAWSLVRKGGAVPWVLIQGEFISTRFDGQHHYILQKATSIYPAQIDDLVDEYEALADVVPLIDRWHRREFGVKA